MLRRVTIKRISQRPHIPDTQKFLNSISIPSGMFLESDDKI